MTQHDGRITLFAPLVTATDTGNTDGRDTADSPFTEVRGRAGEAEAAGIDALLLHDSQSGERTHFEAGTLASALAVCTRTVGLVAAISTEHALPYHVARVLATVDHLTAGRAGWQPMTGGDPDAVANYHGNGSGSASARRSRAVEFTTVLRGLWDSFDDDAFVRDRDSALYFTPEKLHPLDHRGEHFDVAGPLNIARPPQGHPLLVHRVTDTSDSDDLALAARFADVVLLPAQSGQEAARVREAVHERARAAGRSTGGIAVLLDWPVEGGPEEAGRLTRLYDAGAADGFTLVTPAGAAGPAHKAVLALAADVRAKEGRTRPTARPGATLRERLNLPRPASRYETAPQAVLEAQEASGHP
ncbi:hypothetical protein CIB93_36855 [Streptomyces sp. WZ.A104]|uniref:LLM class flavin-dependent oxidoreductase n=1 Tax=Streptomyces sp. WZ.A104 TaxID=2023771 RepID=UPI000BBCA97F|nr:LLM class flavin-dependent oxidoreductase [Streptomyces sp. WZ.A104]PCG81170.1 hypothetical protein CIB93_36855 [Streptomyces sp. WZ.A104]